MKTGTLEAVSNQATWTDIIQLYDDDDGEPFDTADIAEVTISLRNPDGGSADLVGTVSGGDLVAVGATADGTYEFTFSAEAMSELCAKTYEVGVLVEHEDGQITQAILGRLPVLNGL